MGKLIMFPGVIAPVAPTEQNRIHANALPKPAPGVHGYYPEMGGAKPSCEVEAMYCRGAYYIKTPLQLKGRGIAPLETLKASDLHPSAQHKAGWNRYKVTPKALQALKAQHSISYEMLLD